MKKKKKKIRLKKPISNRKGFSLIELMAVLIIVGALSAIAIAAATSAIGKSRAEKTEQNKKNVVMAAKMYVQNNRDLLPRNIGETVLVKFDVLKNSNYLKETVTNDKGESCMNNSVIRIYKLSNSEYTYTPYLYCGSEKAPDVIEPPKPEIKNFKFNYTKDDNDNNPGVISSVSKANFSFKIFGKRDIDTNGSGEIYGYSYSILVKQNNNEFTEAFSSGTLSGNNKTEIEFASKPIVEYIDITGETTVKIIVNVTNVEGGTATYDSSTSGEVSKFDDKIPPICGEVLGAAANDNDWISKENMDTVNYPRVISVKCSDGDGSGCKRDLFSDSWPDQKDYLYGTKFANVKLEDNAVMSSEGKVEKANSTLCRVKVNADIQSPSLSLKVVNPSGKTTETATISVADRKEPNKDYPSTTLKSDVYVGQKGKSGGTQWLNKANYEKGISYNVTITDNIYLYRWEWLTNPGYIKGESSETEIKNNVSISNPDGASGVFVTDINEYEDKDFGPVTENITVSFYTEGMRYGILRVYDKSGNYTDINIYANLDRTAPPIPTTHYEKIDGSAYSSVTLPTLGNLERNHWSTKHIFAYIENQKDDYLTESAAFKVELSGWKEFRHVFSKQTGITRDGVVASNYTFADQNEEVTSEKKDNDRKYGYTIKDEGTHTIKFRSCDNADNCSEYNFNREVNDYTYNSAPYVKIDTIAPNCEVKLDYPRGEPLCVKDTKSTSTYCGTKVTDKMNGWLGWNDNINDLNYTASGENKKVAIVSGLCTDTDTTYASLCDGIVLGQDGYDYSVPTDTEIKTLYDKYYKFPTVLQPYHRYDYDIDTTTAGAGGNNNSGTVIDIAGNKTDCSKSANPTYYTVKIDYTRPVCTSTTTSNGSTYNGEWLGRGRSVDYVTNGTDNGKTSSGVWERYSVYNTTYRNEVNTNNATTNRSHSNIFDDGTKAYDSNGNVQSTRLYIYDQAGNRSSEACPSKVIKIDTTGPECIVDAHTNGHSSRKNFDRFNTEGAYTGDWVNGDYTVTVRRMCAYDSIGSNQDPYGDYHGSGCTNDSDIAEKTYSKISNQAFSLAKGAVTDSSSGEVRDYVGNTTRCGLFRNVSIDDYYPVCTVKRDNGCHSGTNCWNNAAEGVSITSTCNDGYDGKSSGCDENPELGYEYKATKTKKYNAIPDGVIKKDNGGSIDYGNSGWVVDKVGNVSKKKCDANLKVWIDDQDPTCEDTVYNNDGNWVNANGTKPYFKAVCNDGNGSGCVKDCFGEQFNNDYNTTKTVKNVAEDKVGNKKNCSKYGQSYTIKVQKTLPKCSAWSDSPYDSQVRANGSQYGVKISWECKNYSNTGEGSPAAINSCGGASGTSGNVSNQKYSKTITVSDVAGNQNSCSETVTSKTYYNFESSTSCNKCCTRSSCYSSSSCSCSRGCSKGSITRNTCQTVEGKTTGSCSCEYYDYSKESYSCSKCTAPTSGYRDAGWFTSSTKSNTTSTAYRLKGSRTLYNGSKHSSNISFSSGRVSEVVTNCAGLGSGGTPSTPPSPTPTPSTITQSPSPSPVVSSPSPSPSSAYDGLYEPCRDETVDYTQGTRTALHCTPQLGSQNHCANAYNNQNYDKGKFKGKDYGTTIFEIVGEVGDFYEVKVSDGGTKCWYAGCSADTYYVYKNCLRKQGASNSCLGTCKG